MKSDLYFVGVGGQGVLTIGHIIMEAALRLGIPASFYPTKGMAQRGGAVKAQLRLGREMAGPEIPVRGADLAIAMELSEALKSLRFTKRGGDLVLYGHAWLPSAVMLGKAPYPTPEDVEGAVASAGIRLHYLDPAGLPRFDGLPVPANIYVLGAALGRTPLGEGLCPEIVADLIATRWARGQQANRLALEAGLES